jgi:probable HAF family extracellular repeat protein
VIDYATEWSDSNVINLGALPGSTFSVATGINDAGQVVGYSEGSVGAVFHAIEWSDGSNDGPGRPARRHI